MPKAAAPYCHARSMDVSGRFSDARHVRAEFSLTALAYNLRRALNLVGVEALTVAVTT